MQKLNTVLIVLLAAAVIYLLVDRNKNTGPDITAPATEVEIAEEPTNPNDGRIAYVNIDSLNARYAFLDDMKDKLDKEQDRARSRMKNKMTKAEQRAQQLQSTVQTMSEQDYYAAQAELQQLQVDIQAYQERLANELLVMEQEMQSDLNKRIHSFLEGYNEEQGYDYVLGFQEGGQVLFGKEALDITAVTVDALNELYTAEKEEKANAEEATSEK